MSQQQLTETREQMLQRRAKALGATDIAALFGISPYKTAYEVWLEKRGLLEHAPANDAMKLGLALEPGLLDLAEERFGRMMRQVPAGCSDAPIASTCDGILTDGSNSPVEIKTAGLAGYTADVTHWGDAGSDQIPDWYLVQVHTQLLCTQAERAYVLALIAGRGIVHYQINRDDSVCEAIKQKARQWWADHIEGNEIPEFDPPPSVDVLKRIKRCDGGTVGFDHESAQLVHQLEVAKKAFSDAKDAVDILKSKIIVRLGTAEEAILPDGRRVEYLETRRAGYTVEPVSYRTLRIKKAMK